MSLPLVGEACARELDGTWFGAIVCFVNTEGNLMNIIYNDDGKVESDIEIDSEEIRFFSKLKNTGNSAVQPADFEVENLSDEVSKLSADSEIASAPTSLAISHITTKSVNSAVLVNDDGVVPSAAPKVEAILSASERSMAPEVSLCISLASVMHLFDRKELQQRPPQHNQHQTPAVDPASVTNGNVYAPLAGRCNNGHCLKLTPYRCARCNTAFYCSKRCQKENWKIHSTVCIETKRNSLREHLLCFA